MNRLRANLTLLIAVAIWGINFAVVKIALKDLPPYTFLALRFIVATLAFLPILLWELRRAGREAAASKYPERHKWTMPALAAGLSLFSAYVAQTVGMRYTTASVAGFLTSLYIVFVPLLSWLVLRRSVSRFGIMGIMVSLLGLWVVGSGAEIRFGMGEWLVVGSAICYSVQMVLLERFSPQMSAVQLTFGQIAVVTVGAVATAVCFELPENGLPHLSWTAIRAILFTGIVATGVAYLIQTFAQKYTGAIDTAVVFATEPLFAAFGGFLILDEAIGASMVGGGALLVLGLIMVNLSKVRLRS